MILADNLASIIDTRIEAPKMRISFGSVRNYTCPHEILVSLLIQSRRYRREYLNGA